MRRSVSSLLLTLVLSLAVLPLLPGRPSATAQVSQPQTPFRPSAGPALPVGERLVSGAGAAPVEGRARGHASDSDGVPVGRASDSAAPGVDLGAGQADADGSRRRVRAWNARKRHRPRRAR